ncbi:MAG: hypothetical protein ACLVJO_01245 [[Clostridium] scindens]
MGNNGAETTVLKCVIGVLQYDFREIIIDGLMLDIMRKNTKKKIGMVFDSDIFMKV